MGVFEEILENVDSTEAKKSSLGKSIFTLVSDWREFEKHVELTQKRFQECFSELERKEKNLHSVQELVKQNSEEWKLMQQQVEERMREVDDKEKGLVLLEEKGMMKLALEEKAFELKSGELVDEIREKENKLNEREFLINGLSEKLELEKNELVGVEKLLEDRLRELGLKEERVEEMGKEMEIIKDGISRRVNKLDARERKVKEREKMVNFKEMDSLRVDRERVIEMREKDLKLMREDLELKEKEIDFQLALNDKRAKDLDTREKQLEVEKKGLMITQGLMNDVQLKKKELLERGNKELELEKKELEDSLQSLKEETDIKLEAKRRELEVAEKGLKDCQSKTKQCQSEKELLEDRVKELELKKKELEDKIKGINELQGLEKQFEAKRKELEEVTQKRLLECQLKEKQFQSEKELFEKRNKESELKIKELEDRIKSFEIRVKELDAEQKKLNDKLHAQEPVKKVDKSLNSNPSPNFTLAVELDGQDVHISLNGLKIDLSSNDEVFQALRLSGAPVHLVLNAIEALYPPYLTKVDMRFEGNVARSCIVLLEQLIKISPNIQSHQREHALKLAREWKAVTSTGNSSELLSFLYLLASFDLASEFDTEDVIKLLETAAEHRQLIPDLCRHLGLRDKIPGVIENMLIGNKHSLQAIELIYAFELVDQFPPVPILKSYVKYSRRITKRKPKNTVKQNDAIDERIAVIKAVIRCIDDHKLESQYSAKILQTTIEQLLMQKKVHDKCSESVVHYKAEDQSEVEGREIPICSGTDVNIEAQDQPGIAEGDIPSTNLPNSLKGCEIDPELSNTDVAPLQPMALILANMNGKNLLSFLDAHVVDHQQLQKEVSTALQISDDSAKLVLDAVKGFYSSSQGQAKSCLLLLEQLMRISPFIPVDVNIIAQQIALDWKAKIGAVENPLVILVFLMFISTYSLGSAFNTIELVQLYKFVLESDSGLCQSLGISEMTLGVPYSQLESHQIKAEDMQAEIKTATSTTIVKNGADSLCSNVKLESEEHILGCSQIPRFIQNSSDPAQLVLDALYLTYFCDSLKNEIPQLVVKSSYYLLKQLMSFSPEIKPSVKKEALDLACARKSKLAGSNYWEVFTFLQLLGTYRLSYSFSAKDLLGLLEVPSQLLKEASNLIRILSLEDEVPGFIMGLVHKKQNLLAFEYVYEFNLVHKIPPVGLLKKHVYRLRMITKDICKGGQATLEAQDCAISDEISALQNVIKCILDHSLESKYSPDELRKIVAELETQRANLKTSTPATSSASRKAQLKQRYKRKRPASARAITKHAPLPPPPPSKKFRHSNAPPPESASNYKLSDGQSSRYLQPSSYNPHSMGGFNPTMQPSNGVGLPFGAIYPGFPVHQFVWPSNHFPTI